MKTWAVSSKLKQSNVVIPIIVAYCINHRWGFSWQSFWWDAELRFSPFLFPLSLHAYTNTPLAVLLSHEASKDLNETPPEQTQTLEECFSDCSVVTTLYQYWSNAKVTVCCLSQNILSREKKKKHWVEILNKWPIQGSTPWPWCWHHALTNWAI